MGPERRDLINILLQTLPGIAVTYQGEELGLVNTPLTWEQTVDPSACNTQDPVNFEKVSRDPCRTPFPWDNSTFAGFTTGNSTWLPVNPDYVTMNVQSERDAANSHLKIFKKLTSLRKKDVLRQGEYESILTNNKNVMIIRRWYGATDVALSILNFGSADETVDLVTAFANVTLPTQLPVYTASLDTLTEGVNQTLSSVTVPAKKGKSKFRKSP